MWQKNLVLLFALGLLSSCQCPETQFVYLPVALQGKVEKVEVCRADHCYEDVLKQALLGENQGGIADDGVLLKTTADVPVYRLWDGPVVRDNGTTNRIGDWWVVDKPSGDKTGYQQKNAICTSWNAMKWVAECTLKKGALVVVGSTQSMDCALPNGTEKYPANPSIQLYVDDVKHNVRCGNYKKPDMPTPNDNNKYDYEADPQELSRELPKSNKP
jgi:hypothetical protein